MFETLTDDQVAYCAAGLVMEEYEINDDVILQGDEGDSFYLLEKGECQAAIEMANATEQVVGMGDGVRW